MRDTVNILSFALAGSEMTRRIVLTPEVYFCVDTKMRRYFLWVFWNYFYWPSA